MSRTCGICKDQLRPMIDAALVSGESYATLARRTNFSEDAISRHARRHLARVPTDPVDLESCLDGWITKITALYSQAGATSDVRGQIECARTMMGLLSQKQAASERRKAEEAEAKTDDALPVEWVTRTVAEVDAHIRTNEVATGNCHACGQSLPKPGPRFVTETLQQ